MTYGDFFKGKKVAVVGLGPSGQMRSDVKFLLKVCASVAVYDLRGMPALRRVISDLKTVGLKDYFLGGVSPEALSAYDLIILSPETPRSADFLKESRNRNIPIEYPDILTLKLAPAVTVVGVMGSAGKKAIMSMLAESLKRGFRTTKMPSPIIIDGESSTGSLAILPRIKKDGVVIVRMPDESLGEYARARLSPSVAVMAVLPSVRDPFVALAYQTYNNFLITTDEIADMLHDSAEHRSKAKIIRTRAGRVPTEWGIVWRGEHEREDAALVLETTALFKINEHSVRQAAEDFSEKKSDGGLSFVKKVKGVGFYNDSSSERPSATLAALSALKAADPSPIVLLMGGAATEADYNDFTKRLPNYVSTVVLVPGSGTVGIRRLLASREHLKCLSAPSVESAVKLARAEARVGDRVLYSPAFAAGGVDRSRSERSERFVKAVRGLW